MEKNRRHSVVRLKNRKERAGVATAKTPNHQQEGTLSLDFCQATNAELSLAKDLEL